MRIDEVQLNEVYWTRVSGKKVQVIVKDIIENYRGRRQLKIFRLDNGRELQNRNAAALHRTRDFMEH